MTSPPVPAVKGKGFGAWFTGHKTQAYIGTAAAVATLALYVRSKNNAAAASTGTTASTAVPTSTADTTGTDAFNGIEDQVLGLQSALLGIQNGTGSSTGVTPPTNLGQLPVTQLPASTTPALATAPALGYTESLNQEVNADVATGLPLPTLGNQSGLPYGLSYISDAPNPKAPNGSNDPYYNPATGV